MIEGSRVFWLVAFLVTVDLVFCPRTIRAQTNDLEIGVAEVAPSETNAYKVSSLTVKGRNVGSLALPLKVGDLWTPEKQFEVLEAIRDAFANDPLQDHLFNQAGEVGVFYVDVKEEKDETAHTVKLTFNPLQVRLSLTKLGNNVMPIPRSPSPSRYEAVPAPLLALNPTYGLTYDRAFGTSIGGGIDSDLLTLPDVFRGKPAPDTDHHLNARLSGAKSFDEFYRAHGSLDYSLRRFGATLQELSLGGGYDGVKEPLATSTHTENSGGANIGGTLRLASHTRLTLGTGFRHADDLLEDAAGRTRTATEVQPNRFLLESLLPRPFGGFLRLGLWEDNGWTDEGFGAHQRLAARIGYAREFAIAQNQTIGLELLAGGGRLWGDAPSSRRFFGGNDSGQFLYDSVNSPGLASMPGGPLIRSFGEGQAIGKGGGAARGGDSFWHVNLNLTIPIRRFSFPLIPDDEEVRSMLRNGINVSGRNFLISALKQQGMSRDEAVAEADRTLGAIRPATDFIIDEANFYAIKPLFMFDAGGLSGAGNDATWTAAGGGIQLTVVTAKFEVGYMHTLSGPISGARGSVFLRLVFQNLF